MCVLVVTGCHYMPGANNSFSISSLPEGETVTVTVSTARQRWLHLNPTQHSKQRQADLLVQNQPGLQSKLLNSKGYTEKLCLEKQNNSKRSHTHTEGYWDGTEGMGSTTELHASPHFILFS